ncbi:hypothetical protein [Nocardioides sp. zg-1230]|uniref:hypothetical protein n=1 Tax=Nocardioides sp. zg-1230 TaxID=2736601 RepID=UPI0015575128|nr:hypothetical protein [Nocardioides sp. zg-1230]NPC43206.1 hypothetical protein [Nocardioides sp. zg-1230]NPC44890.1 hypothetical protein [Nocardioides sp. zg-1230]
MISQDVVRREVLWANDRAGNPAIGMIDVMARYALDQCFSADRRGHPASRPLRRHGAAYVDGLDETTIRAGKPWTTSSDA